MQKTKIKKFAEEIKTLTLDISFNGGVGHVGSALSIADILSVLYFNELNLRKKNIDSKGRDRFILSKGHAVASLYACLYKKRIITKQELFSFAKNEGLCEHPLIEDKGIEMTTGSLGHGLAFGIGTALAQKKDKFKSRTFVLLSDGECNEGSIWEAAMLAPRLNLENLIVILDHNNWQCFGRVNDVVSFEPIKEKWSSFGWITKEVDGHDLLEIQKTFNNLPFSRKAPSLILAKTVNGKGISLIEDKLVAHYKKFDRDEYTIAKAELKTTA